jgi:hypothetical protein
MSEDRISQLSKRFQRHTAGGRPPETSKTRERKSFYIDAALVARLDQVFRAINHDLYPKQVSKSTFLETVMERGLANMDELKAVLSEQTDTE